MNNEQRRSQARRRRIQVITRSIQELSQQLNRLILEEDRQNPPSAVRALPLPAELRPTHQPVFEINDRVVITNNYLGLKGTKGTLVRVSAKQVWIRVDGDDRVYQKSRNNVCKLRWEEDIGVVSGLN